MPPQLSEEELPGGDALYLSTVNNSIPVHLRTAVIPAHGMKNARAMRVEFAPVLNAAKIGPAEIFDDRFATKAVAGGK
ncbi:hypothetical protein K9U40_05465 [Xanthobacter autotrophicus]|uniref:hypothetical protein n=1 Tax=Xanthobacter TaxID=279 RepID=UPI0024AC2FFE|nr:hypothetical protein [Xanthobacter autotrophicus]MDI4663776.1 hypothetical protein [Xanthobacter autotrophicus]